jgi:hypothetical protein
MDKGQKRSIRSISRRQFLHVGGIAFGSLASHFYNLQKVPGLNEGHRIEPSEGSYQIQPMNALQEFPQSERLGRVSVGKIDLKLRPDTDSQTLGVLYQDAVVPWLREVVGRNPTRISQRWVETPDGYLWSPYLQPVLNEPNVPLDELPETSLGTGMWVEVTVPWVDLILDNPPARSPWLKDADRPRLYYTQILWVDDVKINSNGQRLYRVNERYSYGDRFWAAAQAFRPITEEEILPIHPETEEKRVIINVSDQTLSCYESGSEVYFCRVSTGAKFDAYGNEVDAWATPLGPHPIWRKLLSLHMSGGTTGAGYDLPGIGWTSLFVGDGVAIHSTFWHNNYGVPMSHGCVNARPEDAKWIFRWVNPVVGLDPGDITVPMPGGTIVEVVED